MPSGFSATDYAARFDDLAASGVDVHGEVAFVQMFGPARVLDAGCGTGRVASELANRGVDVVGVDVSADMIAVARDRRPDLDWRVGDLVDMRLAKEFDVVVMAGNVMIFVAPGTEAAVVANVARHLAPGGLLVAGFQLRPDGYGVDEYDAHAIAAGLELVERWSTWGRQPWTNGDYAVSVHRRPA
jgi:SAM-dependent methyltransferase